MKENRAGDVFLQIVESKKGDGADFDRHQIAIFAEDMQKVLKGLDDSLKFIEKDKKERAKARAEKKAAKEAKYGKGAEKTGKKVIKRHNPDAGDTGAERGQESPGQPRSGRGIFFRQDGERKEKNICHPRKTPARAAVFSVFVEDFIGCMVYLPNGGAQCTNRT